MRRQNPARHVQYDRSAMRELELFMDNDAPLYRRKQEFVKNLLRKIKGGRYDHRKAPRLWLYWVDEGARKYLREFSPGSRLQDVFPVTVRRQLAKHYALEFVRQVRSGEIPVS